MNTERCGIIVSNLPCI